MLGITRYCTAYLLRLDLLIVLGTDWAMANLSECRIIHVGWVKIKQPRSDDGSWLTCWQPDPQVKEAHNRVRANQLAVCSAKPCPIPAAGSISRTMILPFVAALCRQLDLPMLMVSIVWTASYQWRWALWA